MRDFQDTFETRKRILINSFSIYMTVPVKSATVARAICQKLLREIIKKSHRMDVAKYQTAIAEKKQDAQWKETVKLMR